MNNTTRSELSFSPTVEDDGKFMVCRAENPVVSGLFLESTWKLSVVCEYHPPPRHFIQELFKYLSFFESLLSLFMSSPSRAHDAFILKLCDSMRAAFDSYS